MGHFRNFVLGGIAVVVVFGSIMAASLWWNSPNKPERTSTSNTPANHDHDRGGLTGTRKQWASDLEEKLSLLEGREADLSHREKVLSKREQQLLTIMEDIRAERQALLSAKSQLLGASKNNTPAEIPLPIEGGPGAGRGP